MINWHAYENELIRFAYKKIWQEEWRGNELPKHVFRSFLSNVETISESFTNERQKLKANYLEAKEGRFAYLLYFHLANVARNMAVFEEMKKRNLFQVMPKRVLDLGTGLGAAVWALSLSLKEMMAEPVEIVACDRSKKALQDMLELFRAFSTLENLPQLSLRTKILDFFDPRTAKQMAQMPKFDLIVCSNVINELAEISEAKSVGVVRSLFSMLSAQGQIVIVEPALNQTSRRLTLLRDKILETQSYDVPAPCGHQGTCPLNNEPRDWCHFDTFWTPPPLRKKIETALDHQSGTLKYSYVVFSKQKRPAQKNQYRVISDMLHERDGTFSWLLCSETKKIKLVVGKEEVRSDVFRAMRRGAVVEGLFEALVRRQESSSYASNVRLKNETSLIVIEGTSL